MAVMHTRKHHMREQTETSTIDAGIDVEQFNSEGDPTDRLQITLKGAAA
jgi:hypothetical protein